MCRREWYALSQHSLHQLPQRLCLLRLWFLKHAQYPMDQELARLSKLALSRPRDMRHSVLELGVQRRGLRSRILCLLKRLQPEPRSVRTGVYPLLAMGKMFS